ncbi:transcription antitermination factor NusB [Alkaliphilus hydrothermalis]|uniref:Transcription antitermination protein NusB n=1 Tax=Alkaliphilus hydrothermalis TaxID=1482730 RepID=A0ABS2NN51_9FIRM|nr:transcription antitermination factor NusB [Alkaliphilus hydrothermalis]MBM7614004.1 N utilization substance protein B [Alkaliphilus hydrothermalis]
MNRKLAREFCMKMLFEMGIHNNFDVNLIKGRLEEENESIEVQQMEYIQDLLKAVIENKATLDEIIVAFSKGWKLDRIAKVDLAILRIGLAELLYMDNIPFAVSINEAIELAKKYSTNESASFINGILGRYVEEKGINKND